VWDVEVVVDAFRAGLRRLLEGGEKKGVCEALPERRERKYAQKKVISGCLVQTSAKPEKKKTKPLQ